MTPIFCAVSIQSLPIHYGVPSWFGCSVLIQSCPAVVNDEFYVWIAQRSQRHLKEEGLPEVRHHRVVPIRVELSVRPIWGRGPRKITWKGQKDWLDPPPKKNTQPHLTLSKTHLNCESSHSGLGHWCSGLRHGGISFSGIHRVDAGEHKSVTGVR